MDYSFENMQWEGENKLSLFPYYPWRSSHRNDITHLVLNFKKGEVFAVQRMKQCATQALEYSEFDLRDIVDSWYILAIPGSAVNMPNAPCEAVCEHLASVFLWLHYIPGGLVRTMTVPKSARAQKEQRDRTNQLTHAQTIFYAGPPLHPSKGIIAVDDVLTTSSTFNACYGILKRATPCQQIFGLFMARTQFD